MLLQTPKIEKINVQKAINQQHLPGGYNHVNLYGSPNLISGLECPNKYSPNFIYPPICGDGIPQLFCTTILTLCLNTSKGIFCQTAGM